MAFAMPANRHSTTMWVLRMLGLCRLTFGTCALLIALMGAANAHPHMWVDLKSQIVLGDDGSVAAIRQEWLFDDFFSVALIEEASQHPQGLDAGIFAKIAEILENLQPYDYFTVARYGDETLPLSRMGDITADVSENRVWMGFTVAVGNSVNLATKQFSYAIFDPTYYIEMFHAEGETISFEGDAPAGCGTEIVQPNPSAGAIALSQSASLDANPDYTIGRLFAETVHVNCQ